LAKAVLYEPEGRGQACEIRELTIIMGEASIIGIICKRQAAFLIST
jgi:hypothetical protein